MKVEEAAKKLGWSAEYLRAAARCQRVPFCLAIQKNPEKSKRWCYKINDAALEKYLKGQWEIKVEKVEVPNMQINN